jgi:glutamate/aspartate transport system permease protein
MAALRLPKGHNQKSEGGEIVLSYNFNWSIIWTAPYGEWMLQGIWTTIRLGLISWFIALFLGIIIGTFRVTPFRPLRVFGTVYTEIFRDIPLLVQLFFWYFAAPSILPKSIEMWLYRGLPNSEFWIVVVGLSIYTSSRIAEHIRAGMQAIPDDQYNAALSTGFTHFQTYRYIIIPFAVRLVIPPLTAECLTVFKNTALAMTVGVLETTFMSQQIEAYTFHGIEATTAASIVYMVITLIVVLLMGLVEKRLAVPGLIMRKGGQ